MPATRVALIGKGNVGSALQEGLERAGYSVTAVGKRPDQVRDAAREATIIVLAVPYGERQNALREIGDENLKGKVLVDVTNALTPDYGYAASFDRSGAEELQGWAKNAKVVKAFNTVFAQNMATGNVKGETLSLLVAGDDANAKHAVLDLGRALGFDPVDAGPLRNARWLEALGYLNIQLGYTQKLGTDIGFRVAGLKGSTRQEAGPARRANEAERRSEEASTRRT